MIWMMFKANGDSRLAGCQQDLFLRKQQSCDFFVCSQQNGNIVGNGNTFLSFMMFLKLRVIFLRVRAFV